MQPSIHMSNIKKMYGKIFFSVCLIGTLLYLPADDAPQGRVVYLEIILYTFEYVAYMI